MARIECIFVTLTGTTTSATTTTTTVTETATPLPSCLPSGQAESGGGSFACSYYIYRGQSGTISGGNYVANSAMTFSSCITACDNDQACATVNFVPSTSSCTLIDKPQGAGVPNSFVDAYTGTADADSDSALLNYNVFC
ncbi:hypothetical protein B0A55_00632 [Friedmanniomyces simplex]|uniref:Uncharacterized protein n=1 Tax=Friedmanniomyces simplex TaxID=329884 RepID=A0A4U0XZ38_9PEZI|nr:hypothetical protein B0A55_00632 [Friedmanniomyces simplex]